MNNIPDWYHVKDAEQLDSPALLLYPERIKQNIALVKTMIDDVSRLRPHVKTSKSPDVIRLMMEAGIKKFKCATIAEAEMLATCHAPDILLAYQLTYPKILRFIHLIKTYTRSCFSCLVDNQESAALLSATAVENDLVIKVYIDLNVGMNRTGIKPGKEAMSLYEKVLLMSGLKLVGLHAYDGHIREKNFEKRTRICKDAFSSTEEMRANLKSRGYMLPGLVAGGSPTFAIHAQRENTECSPGTFVFWDKGYADSIPEQPFVFAALVLARVVSLPDEERICIDLGYKAVASENDLNSRVFFLNAPGLVPVSHSEEHMVLKAEKAHHFKIGDLLYALPVHICPTVALYSHATCIEDGMVTDTWKITARDRSIGS